MTRIRRFDDVHEFAARARPWLLRDEAANNLLLSVIDRLEAAPAAYGEPVYLAAVEVDGDIAGWAFRTGEFKLGLTDMPLGAVPALADDLHGAYDTLPAVLGSHEVARAFAFEWGARTGVTPRQGMRQRIYRLDRLKPPAHPPAGRLRSAMPDDIGLVERWIDAFTIDLKMPLRPGRSLAPERIAEGSLFLWDDGEPRSMAGFSGRTPNGVRIGYVYTPPELRGRGYASAATAGASQRALDAGSRFCFLYTDLGNPTSNSIYTRIGYRPVADVVDWLLAD